MEAESAEPVGIFLLPLPQQTMYAAAQIGIAHRIMICRKNSGFS